MRASNNVGETLGVAFTIQLPASSILPSVIVVSTIYELGGILVGSIDRTLQRELFVLE